MGSSMDPAMSVMTPKNTSAKRVTSSTTTKASLMSIIMITTEMVWNSPYLHRQNEDAGHRQPIIPRIRVMLLRVCNPTIHLH